MKLIIPMAGRGTRVRPHSHAVPKPLLPVAGTMIIERLVETFIRTMDRNIEEIVYILGPDFGNPIKEPLQEMSVRHGAKCTFRVQDVALGTAHAVYCAQQDLEGEVIIAFADTLFDSKETFNVDGADSVIWLKKVEDPSRFGVAVYEGEQITGFVEKPTEFISDLAIIGVYYFKDGSKLKTELQYVLDNDIKGPGGEYFLTEALDRMIQDGKLFKTATVDEWLDCGTLPAWLETTGIIVEKEAQNSSEQIEKWPKTNDIRKELDYEERLNILELMWEIVLVDDIIDVFEAQLMRRVSGLLYISDIDSGNSKKRAIQKLKNN